MVQKSGKLTSWYGKYPIYSQGFYTSQVVNRISEPSTVSLSDYWWKADAEPFMVWDHLGLSGEEPRNSLDPFSPWFVAGWPPTLPNNVQK